MFKVISREPRPPYSGGMTFDKSAKEIVLHQGQSISVHIRMEQSKAS